ncbi:probable G-protein coupled receptor Mth-like 10 [Pseudomyrmex gracilis]|uniref:probable G-protein coupled receptor Mth-like 10 n=1 Tax=Pseudomyrmex gracilis TaxID=219809 RepID=UPI00099561C7|nr:probable G-protein coupled receptor Mth-like 10 [Pseudomyrmex gracilis]XP_020293031.1 probable G-protein coupled receptor Mth-like 10 [Pseudomyrmex gracilis]
MSFICILLMCLTAPIARASDVPPIVRTVQLQNSTFLVPEEYKRLPVVAKCCSVNEQLAKDSNGNTVCASSNDSTAYFSPFFSDFNRTGILLPGDESKEFVAVVGSPCNRKYMLHPEENSEDEYYLLLNGSIFAPRLDHVPIMLTPGEDYCMELVPELGLRVLVCFSEDTAVTIADARLIIYASGLLISVPFFILTIVAYTITPRLRDVLGRALCHYCGCLAVAFTTLAITQLAGAQLPSQVCVSIAFVIQFSFVACFFWLNVMCIETWSLVCHHVSHRSYRRIQSKTLFFYYSIWAWGSSAILILVSMAMDLSPTIPMTYVKPTFGTESCWFKSDAEAMPYFYVPVGLLLLMNTILFILTAVKISRYQQEQLALRQMSRNQHSDRDQRLFRRLTRTFIVCLVLFFLMGLNWTMELISWFAGGDPLDWSAFDLINALQGVLIFGLFVIRRPPRDFIWHRIQKLRGIHTTEPDVGSMDLALLPVINADSLPRQTVVQ